MGWSDRLFRRATGDPRRSAVELLCAASNSSAGQAARLAAAAAAAPNAGAQAALRGLAADAERRAEALAVAARERGGTDAGIPLAADTSAPARNHWGRLVAALEADRAARDDLQQELPELLEIDPTLAEILRAALHGFDAELLELRALIARADPQALD